jgi:hypothetical protein
VCEELKGPERAFMSGRYGVQRLVEKMTNSKTLNPYVRGTTYFGHKTDIIIDENSDLPKVAGDRSVR